MLILPLIACSPSDSGGVMLSSADQSVLGIKITDTAEHDPERIMNSAMPDRLPELGSHGLSYWLPGQFSEATSPDYLEVNYPIFDRLDVWFKTPDGLVHQMAGDTVPLDRRSTRQGLLVFPVPEGSQSYVFRLQTAGFLPWSLTQWDTEAYTEHLAAESLWYGIFFGGILVLLAYNLFLFISLRDPNYLLYLGYLLFLSAFQAFRSGHVQLYIWPWGGDGINALLLITISFGTIFGLLFCNRFLAVRQRFPRWWWSSVALITLASVIIVLAPQAELYNRLLRLIAAMNILALFYYISTVVAAIRIGVKQARYLLPAFGLFFVATSIHLLWTFGILPDLYAFRHAMEYGLLCEAVLLSFALADRINILSRQKRTAEQLAIDGQQQFSHQLIATQEKEREMISNTLHDSIGHGLLVMRQQLARLSGETQTPERAKALAEMADQARDVLDDVRGLSHDLHPHILQRLGLKAALESTLERAFTGTNTEWTTEIENLDQILDRDQCLAIYRVIQEAINNIIRHTDASEVIVTLHRVNDLIQGSVKDDGHGFQPYAETEAGLGVSTMEGRMQLLDGLLTIDSSEEAGTAVNFQLPLRTKRDQ